MASVSTLLDLDSPSLPATRQSASFDIHVDNANSVSLMDPFSGYCEVHFKLVLVTDRQTDGQTGAALSTLSVMEQSVITIMRTWQRWSLMSGDSSHHNHLHFFSRSVPTVRCRYCSADQRCPWVHFSKSSPTQSTRLLTHVQSNPVFILSAKTSSDMFSNWISFM